MATLLKGGCSCGAVRFAIDDYIYAQACHCNACKKRTGSAYGISVVVESRNVTEFTGETTIYQRISESGRPVDYHFCPVCATTIKWGIEATPTRQIFAGGAFDNLGDIPMDGEMYTVSALPWSRLGCEVSRADEPDDEYRAALIKFSQSHR